MPLSSGSARRSGYTRMPSVSELPSVSHDGQESGTSGHPTGDIADYDQSLHHDALGISSATDNDADMTSANVTSPPLLPDYSSMSTTPRQSGSIPGSKRYSQTSPDAKFVSSMFSPNADISVHSSGSLETLHKHPNADSWLHNDHAMRERCAARGSTSSSPTAWFYITLLALSAFSTVFSAMYLGVALRGPKYSNVIGQDGMSIQTATTLFALFAKLIELSFVAVFVAFLGQLLSRRALRGVSRSSVSLAQWTLRTWIVQPGSIIVKPETLRYAGWSILGSTCLFTALCAALYTTAAETLVSPTLKFDNFAPQLLQGIVKAQFADPIHATQSCLTLITTDMDPDHYGEICLQIEHAAQGYHNLQQWLSKWIAMAGSGFSSSDPSKRPAGFAMLDDNTTITAPWVEVVDMAVASVTHGRVVNNISMALPHVGIVQAAHDATNGIIQPYGSEGQGDFNIRASVPSPVIHVLCASMTKEELTPIVYNLWVDHDRQLNETEMENWATIAPASDNRTAVDDLFGWGPSYSQNPPIFPDVPDVYQTIMNDTGAYGRDALYMLGTAPRYEFNASGSLVPDETDLDHILCSIRTSLTPFCSSEYNVTVGRGTMAARCEDPSDEQTYIRSNPLAYSGSATTNKDWVETAFAWSRALSLNDGVFHGKAATSRLLMQLMPQKHALDPTMPSLAEALATLGACTLVTSVIDSPFVPYWNYNASRIPNGTYEHFNASIRSQEYSSGGSTHAQRAFFIILFGVFAINVIMFGVLLYWRGLVTDFTEWENMFALSLQSPPADVMNGACAAGPQGHMFSQRWHVTKTGSHIYMAPSLSYRGRNH